MEVFCCWKLLCTPSPAPATASASTFALTPAPAPAPALAPAPAPAPAPAHEIASGQGRLGWDSRIVINWSGISSDHPV